MSPNPALVILAAGKSQRFGSAKQLAIHQDKPLLQHVTHQCLTTKLDCYVVLGANQEAILDTIKFNNAQVLKNTNWSEGMSASIKLATELLSSNYPALLFIAGDQVMIRSEQLLQLVKTWKHQPEKIACSEFNNQLGIPAIYPSAFYQELASLSGDTGGKKIIKKNPDKVIRFQLPEAAIDIDYPEDLNRI